MSQPGAHSRHLKSGWLRKQGGTLRTWQRRWFVLNGDLLFYFAREDDLRPLGSIFLPGNKVIRHEFDAQDPEKYLFEIVSGIIKIFRVDNKVWEVNGQALSLSSILHNLLFLHPKQNYER